MGTPVRVPVLRAAAAALIGTAAACSSSSTPADQSSAVPSSASVAAAAPQTGTSTATHDAFAQCLSDNGVPAPPGVDQATWDKAMRACSSLAPAPPEKK
jgi:hypothetical protein